MGSVVLSLDAELGWGFHDFESPPSRRVESGRRGWSVMLDLLDEFDVPATWGVVGHLMLERCDGRHEDHPAPTGWFERERTDWRDREDLRFATDLVDDLLGADADHEFASHSFSHVLFDDPATDRELANAELARCRELAAARDLSIETFIYPRNGVGHRDVLADHGIVAYRGRSPNRHGARAVYDSTVRDRSFLVEPTVDEYGLVNVPASLFLFGFEGTARTVAESVWTDPMVQVARRGIDEAARSDGMFHMWLHPNNLTHERDDRRMRTILSYLDRKRAQTDLAVTTIGEIARAIHNTEGVDGTVSPANSPSIHGY